MEEHTVRRTRTCTKLATFSSRTRENTSLSLPLESLHWYVQAVFSKKLLDWWFWNISAKAEFQSIETWRLESVRDVRSRISKAGEKLYCGLPETEQISSTYMHGWAKIVQVVRDNDWWYLLHEAAAYVTTAALLNTRKGVWPKNIHCQL